MPVQRPPFTSAAGAQRRLFPSQAIKCQMGAGEKDAGISRRAAFGGAAAVALVAAVPSPALAKPPKGFLELKDSQDGYDFFYPFGWQEVAVNGQDVVYKDIIEPLESVSVSLTPTDKSDVLEFGPPEEVALTLASGVLTPPNQEVKVLDVAKKEKDGRIYVEFEFAAKAQSYIRHSYAVVTVGNGKFYTLTTGANEKRWGKMKPRLQEIIKSFSVQDRYG